MGVRDLACWIYLGHKLSPPFVLEFHSVNADTSLRFSLISGAYIAFVTLHGLSSV
jgi:hypothetical protein